MNRTKKIQKEENLKIVNEYKVKSKLDLLPKWTSIVVWVGILIYLLSTGVLRAQTIYPSSHVEIVGYRIVMSDDMGCWSELQIINENRFINEDTKKLIIDKIAKYELYGLGRGGGESPMLEVKEKNGRISYYHLVKLPSDSSW